MGTMEQANSAGGFSCAPAPSKSTVSVHHHLRHRALEFERLDPARLTFEKPADPLQPVEALSCGLGEISADLLDSPLDVTAVLCKVACPHAHRLTRVSPAGDNQLCRWSVWLHLACWSGNRLGLLIHVQTFEMRSTWRGSASYTT